MGWQVGQKYKLMLASTLNLDSSAMAGHYDVVRRLFLPTAPSLPVLDTPHHPCTIKARSPGGITAVGIWPACSGL